MHDSTNALRRRRLPSELCTKDTLQCAWLESPHPHAQLKSFDASSSLAAPGVRAVLTAGDLHGPLRELLRISRVGYVGDPVGILVADDAAAAREGARRFVAHFAELPELPRASKLPPAAMPLEEAISSEAILSRSRFGFGEDGYLAPSRRVDLELHVPSWSRRPLVRQGSLAIPNPDGSVSLHSAAVDPGGELEAWLKRQLDEPRLRLRFERCSDGCPLPRTEHWEVDVLAVHLALELGRAVYLPLPGAGTHEGDWTVQIRLGLGAGGELVSRDVRAVRIGGYWTDPRTQTAPPPIALSVLPFPCERFEIVELRSHAGPSGALRHQASLLANLASWSSLHLLGRDLGASRPDILRRWSHALAVKLIADERQPRRLFGNGVRGEGVFGGAVGEGLVVHRPEISIEPSTGDITVESWKIENRSGMADGLVRASVYDEVHWALHPPSAELMTTWPTAITMPAVEVVGTGSSGDVDLGYQVGLAGTALLDAITELTGIDALVRLPIRPREVVRAIALRER